MRLPGSRQRWVTCSFAMSMTLACRDRDPQPATSQDATHVAVTESPAPKITTSKDTRRLRVHHGSEIQNVDLSQVEHLDLAMSATDQLGHLADRDVQTACDELDLVELATRTPALRSLRISGCPAQLHAGLGAFGDRIEALELVDVTLDGATLGRMTQLTGLRSLTLKRVEAGAEPLQRLRRLDVSRVELVDLDRDSPLAELLELWPRDLREVELVGSWAGHKAMTMLADAEALEVLELRDTRVGNFSLNQIKGLSRLRDVTLVGKTFNNNSPLHFRELPVTRFSCDCPRLGDAAIRSLRHSEGIIHLELHRTQITGAGLDPLTKLEGLTTLVVGDRDLGPEGFDVLAKFPKLKRLELSGTLEHPELEGLGQLHGLQWLVLGYPNLDDRASGELAKLVNLRHLDLSGTQISDDGLSALRGMSGLRELLLRDTRVTNRGLEHVGQLTHLQQLALDDTDVVDAGVAHLADLVELRELGLDHTLVTDASIDHLMGMKKLERLGLGATVVSAEGAAKLSRLPSLEAVNLAGARVNQ